jgi:hypothetical protein
MARPVSCGLALLSVLVLAAGCGGGLRSPATQTATGELRVREVHLTGAPFAIEGEFTYVRIEGEEHVLHPPADLRIGLTPGSHQVEVWHRTCDGNCGNLDPPTDRCAAEVTVAEGGTALATIRNWPGTPCRIVAGRVGIAYAQTDVRDAKQTSAVIWFSSSDGSHRVRLATGYGAAAPVLAPDGSKVAFVRLHDNPRFVEIYVVPTAGGEPTLLRRVRGRNAFVAQLVWSHDSLRLVSSENPGVFLMRANPPARARRILKGAGAVTFSPDGSQIAYDVSTPKRSDIYIYEIAGGWKRQVTRDGRSFAAVWGPSGIAFSRATTRGAHYDIWTARFAGVRPQRLTRTRAGITPVAWSADGSRLLAENPAMHNGRLWAVDVPSGKARRLTDWVGDLFGQGLSRDGATILAAIGCGGSARPVGRIETIPFAGGQPHVILDGPCRASWNE